MSIQTLLQPNSWSCLPTAAAMVLGAEPKDILDMIGHDGSEFLWPALGDPLGRRGFHIQEIVDVFLGQLVIPVLIEADPTILPFNHETGEPLIKEARCQHVFDSPEERLADYLEDHLAILLGTHSDNPGSGHAVAWDMNQCHDPRGQRYSIEDFQIEGALVLF